MVNFLTDSEEELIIGERIVDIQPRPKWIDAKLSDRGLSVGDLVTYNSVTHNNGMTIYRVDKDCPPQIDAVWGEYTDYYKSAYHKSSNRGELKKRQGWCKKGTRSKIPDVRLRGCIELTPVFQIFPGPSQGRKTVSYDSLWRVKKIDVLALGRAFSGFQEFIMQEIKRIKETADQDSLA